MCFPLDEIQSKKQPSTSFHAVFFFAFSLTLFSGAIDLAIEDAAVEQSGTLEPRLLPPRKDDGCH